MNELLLGIKFNVVVPLTISISPVDTFAANLYIFLFLQESLKLVHKRIRSVYVVNQLLFISLRLRRFY